MKLRRSFPDNKEARQGKRKFPALKGMIENSSRTAMVLMAVSIAAPACSGGDGKADSGKPDVTLDSSRPDSGRQDSGEVEVDSGVQDSEVPVSLCSLHGEDDPKRFVFALGEYSGIAGSEWSMQFLKIKIFGGDTYASFNYHNASLTSGRFETFIKGEQRTIDVKGLGEVKFELCGTTGGECNGNLNPPEGDPSCTATLVAESGWGK